jgi:DNA-damage-inducible protein D
VDWKELPIMDSSNDLTAVPAYHATMERLEQLKHVSARGTDYWRAREICDVLGYVEWRNFEIVLQRAIEACEGVGVRPPNHFVETTKMVILGSGAERRVPDFFLSRSASYLIAMNGDPSKPEIAAAQAYFAVQTRRMELRDHEDAQLAHDQRRLELRGRVTESAKRVSKVAQNAGVRNSSQPFFHDARYRGLYNAPLKDVKQKKGLTEKENLMDRAGPMELSANDFQMNLAAQVIEREGINQEPQAIARNREIAARVRHVIAETGSILPEDLPVEPPIKMIEARLKGSKTLPKPD